MRAVQCAGVPVTGQYCGMALLSHKLLDWQVDAMKPVSGRIMAFVNSTVELSMRPEM